MMEARADFVSQTLYSWILCAFFVARVLGFIVAATSSPTPSPFFVPCLVRQRHCVSDALPTEQLCVGKMLVYVHKVQSVHF